MQISIVDAFSRGPFTGNQAAVCLVETERVSDDWMQSLAAEMNLAETAFVARTEDGFGLRWFTPMVEVDLCGHATLAAAHVMWEREIAAAGAPISFETRSGKLTARQSGDQIQLNFPATPPTECDPPDGLLAALGVESVQYVGKSRFDYLVVLDSEFEVRELKPDLVQLKSVEARGVIVSSVANETETDFVSRFFAPAAGIDEDPVTGSAHCCLSPYWSDRLNQKELVGYQASPRGGVVRTALQGERVLLSGEAVTVVNGDVVV